MRPQSSASSSARCAYSPFRFAVRIWYVAIVTGLISLIWPEYSPISSSVSDRALEQLRPPLARRDRVGHEDERRRVGPRHRAGADEGLARAARQHDDARAAVEEVVDGLLLVRAKVPAVFVEADLVRGARRVAGVVFGGPAELQQLLLHLAARPRLQRPLGGGPADAEERPILELRVISASTAASVVVSTSSPVCRRRRSVARDDEPSVAADRLFDVDRDRLRHRELRVALERREHLLGGVPGRPRIPQAESRDAVGVDVLGARSSSAKTANSCRASSASGCATSSSTVRSLWTIRGPGITTDQPSGREAAFKPGAPRRCARAAGCARCRSAGRARAADRSRGPPARAGTRSPYRPASARPR